MPVQELENLRQKYPQYNGIDDMTLATKLAGKYPQYGFILDKVKAENPQGESGDDWMSKSFPKTARNNLSKLYQGGANSPANVKAQQDLGLEKMKSDLMDIPVAALKTANARMLGIPGAIDKIAGVNMPEATSSGGKLASDIGEFAGGARALTAAYPIAKGAVKAVSKFIPETIKRGAADYLTNTVAPAAHKIFQDAVSKFTPEIINFARKLKVPESAISTMKKFGTQAVEQSKGSGDAIAQRITKGLEEKDKEVEDAYKAATSTAEKNKYVIPLNGTKRAMGSLLRRAGYIDANGKETEMAINDISENSPLRKILGYYKSIGANQEGKVTGVNTLQWSIFRNNLSKLRNSDKSLSGSIKGILDSLHSDGEKAGLTGISKARQLAAKNFAAEDKFTSANGAVKSLMQEKGVGKYHTMSGEQKRSVQELANHIGDKGLVEDIEKHSASQYLDKITEGKSKEGFQELLNKASDRKWTEDSRQKLSELIGKQNADKIINEVIANRRIRIAGKLGAGAGLIGTEEIIRRRLMP